MLYSPFLRQEKLLKIIVIFLSTGSFVSAPPLTLSKQARKAALKSANLEQHNIKEHEKKTALKKQQLAEKRTDLLAMLKRSQEAPPAIENQIETMTRQQALMSAELAARQGKKTFLARPLQETSEATLNKGRREVHRELNRLLDVQHVQKKKSRK